MLCPNGHPRSFQYAAEATAWAVPNVKSSESKGLANIVYFAHKKSFQSVPSDPKVTSKVYLAAITYRDATGYIVR